MIENNSFIFKVAVIIKGPYETLLFTFDLSAIIVDGLNENENLYQTKKTNVSNDQG